MKNKRANRKNKKNDDRCHIVRGTKEEFVWKVTEALDRWSKEVDDDNYITSKEFAKRHLRKKEDNCRIISGTMEEFDSQTAKALYKWNRNLNIERDCISFDEFVKRHPRKIDDGH